MKTRVIIMTLLTSCSFGACTSTAPAPTYSQISTPSTFRQLVTTPVNADQESHYVDQSGRGLIFHRPSSSFDQSVAYSRAQRPAPIIQPGARVYNARSSSRNFTTASLRPAAQMPAPAPTAEQPSLHRVTEGETVYSLARMTCNNVENIQTINSLDGTFKIHIGEVILIPASRC